ncbi:MAG: DUF192 domain-containing protein [Alcaligenaceae bacterium]|nr:DUF192 domain-containing protein [Alcaligenaceae bacterium]
MSFLAPDVIMAKTPNQEQITPLKLLPLRIGEASLLVEVADNNRSRQSGLMHRQFMAEHRGMLFVFEQAQPLCFWMRNTHIPLSIAYLDKDARIIEMFDMQPLDERSICSSAPALFALEVNQGWFERHHIKPGDRLQSGEWHDTIEAEKALQQSQQQ